jgi:hypothetical protein
MVAFIFSPFLDREDGPFREYNAGRPESDDKDEKRLRGLVEIAAEIRFGGRSKDVGGEYWHCGKRILEDSI